MYYRQTVREVSVGGEVSHTLVLQADCKGGICGRSGVSHTLMYYRQTVREVSVGGLGYLTP